MENSFKHNKDLALNSSQFFFFLPDEILSLVFSHLTPKMLCICSQVNRQWYRISISDSLWKHFCALSFPGSEEEITIQYNSSFWKRKYYSYQSTINFTVLNTCVYPSPPNRFKFQLRFGDFESQLRKKIASHLCYEENSFDLMKGSYRLKKREEEQIIRFIENTIWHKVNIVFVCKNSNISF